MASIALFPCSFIDGATIIGELSIQLGLSVYTDELLLLDVAETQGGAVEHYRRVLFDKPQEIPGFSLEKRRHVNLLRQHLVVTMLNGETQKLFYGFHASLFGPEFSSVFRALVLDTDEERTRRAMSQERCPVENARAMIRRHDRKANEWTMFLHGSRAYDAGLYDAVVPYHGRDVFTVVNDLIRLYTDRESRFDRNEVRSVLEDMALTLHVEQALIDSGYQTVVAARGGQVEINVESSSYHFPWLSDQIASCAVAVDGVTGVVVKNTAGGGEQVEIVPPAPSLPEEIIA